MKSISQQSHEIPGNTPKMWTTPKLKISKSTDSDIKIGVHKSIDPAESRSGPIFELGLHFYSGFAFFCQKLENIRNK